MKRLVGLAMLPAVLALAVACNGGGDGGDQTPAGAPSPTASPQASPTGEATYSGVVVTTEHATGANRFSVGVIDNERNEPIAGAAVAFRFFKLTAAGEGELRSQSDAREVAMPRGYIDEDTGELVGSGSISVYVANPEFDEAGDWGVEITGTVDGNTIGPINLPFTVAPPEEVLNVGDPAPKSRQTLASDVEDIAEIDSMRPPDPMHDMTIEDAVTSGRPTVILFGTPAFCETLTCGPVMDTVMLPLYEKYQEQANFIHVEPYFLEEARSGMALCAVPAFNVELARAGVGEGEGACPELSEEELAAVGESWNLTTEPIIFVVDGGGIIAGKFEAVTGPEEVEQVLSDVL
ncbi:MAG: hypothetical protein ACE5JM_01325 [Armatimonadota bacterium]